MFTAFLESTEIKFLNKLCSNCFGLLFESNYFSSNKSFENEISDSENLKLFCLNILKLVKRLLGSIPKSL